MKRSNRGAMVRKVWQPNGDHVQYWPYAFRLEDIEWTTQLDREQSPQEREPKRESYDPRRKGRRHQPG